jgi:beta-mannanase
MHEMNGDWYPWGGTVNGNSAKDYVRAWRRMHDIFSRVGATNVRWVWSPHADDVPGTKANAFERYYPGSAYVDVLALDGYNWGSSPGSFGGWRSFDQIFVAPYARLARLGPQPIWIAETASDTVGGDKAAWIGDMFDFAAKRPRLRAIVWFDVLKERDWRATSPAAAVDSLRAGLLRV